MAVLRNAPNFTSYDNPTVTIGSAYSTDTLRIKLEGIYGGETFTITQWKTIPVSANVVGFDYTVEITDAERQALWKKMESQNELSVVFNLATIANGKTSYFKLTRRFTIVDADPIITASVVDTNDETIALTGNKNIIVKRSSYAKATMSVEAQQCAVMYEDFYRIRHGNDTAYSTTHTFDFPTGDDFVFTAEDSRGNIGKVTLTPTIIDYFPPTNNMAFDRPDALGNVTVACSGNWYNGSFGAVQNTLTAQCRYSNSGWIDMKITQLDSNTYYASAHFTIENFVQSQSYVFETRVVDKLNTVTSNSDAVKSMPVFHWGENDFAFEVPVSVAGDLDVKGNMRLKGSGNYGNRLNFGDGEYCYISEDSDDAMTIHASEIDIDTSNLTIKGQDFIVPRYGTWTPTLLSSAVSSYSSQYGWYIKVGQIVTIGFYIKATCNSGYQNTTISILGLPYTPMYSASGGGMCSGAYVSGGFTFQCYVADTGGKITTRVQSCNHTTQTNLPTSASGCWYPSGGGEITLSGTITFITT